MNHHINSTTHFISFGKVIRDMRKLINDKDISIALKRTFRDKALVQLIMDYIRNIASNREVDPVVNWVDGIMRGVRKNAVVAYLGINLVTMLRQPLSFILGAAEIGENWALRGIYEFVRHHRKVMTFIRRTNPQLAPENRFIQMSIKEMLGDEYYTKFKRMNKQARKLFMYLLRVGDQPTVSSIYYGAYLKYRHSGKSMNEAIQLARMAVEKTQPMARKKSLPAIAKRSELAKLLLIFCNQPMHNFNYIIHDILGKTIAGEQSAFIASKKLLAILVSAVAMGIVSRGRLSRNKEELEKDIMSYMMMNIPVVGPPLATMIKGYDPDFIPEKIIKDAGKIFTAKQKETKIRNLLKTVTTLMGIPWNQPYRWYKAIMRKHKGKSVDIREWIWSRYQLGLQKKKETKKEEKEKIVYPRVNMKEILQGGD